jgi:hypothetical protein
MMRTARCSCGECKVEVEGDPTLNGLCNCDDCRRRTGAPFSWSVYFPNDAVRKIEGPLTTRVVESTNPQTSRRFCAKCGSTLFWTSDGAAETGFAAGCFNDPTLPAPSVVVRYPQRMPWAVFPAECEIVDIERLLQTRASGSR